MATLAEARQKYRAVFGLDPAPTLDAGQLERAVVLKDDINFVRNLYSKEYGINIDWSGDTRDAGQLLRAVRNNNELQDAQADYAKAGKLPEGFDWSKDTRTTDQLRRGISKLTGGIDDFSPYTPDQEKKSEEGIGRPGDEGLTILKGQEMKWFFDKSSGKWYVEYGLPNSSRNMVFEAEPDQMDALFGKGLRPAGYTETSLKNLTARQGSTFAGNISEVEGKGTFESEVERVTALALDDGKLPDWASQDGAALDIIFTAQSEGKSTDWVLDQLSKLPTFKARFPGMDKLMKDNNLSLGEGIQGFLEFESGVKQSLKAGGYEAAAVTPDLVGQLLDQGHSLTVINDTVSGFRRMEQFAPAMQAFNQILTEKGMQPISDLQEMFNFVKGNASAEIYDLYEASSIQEAAVGAGLGDVFSSTDAVRVAAGSQQTLESATVGMQKAAELLLRLRTEVEVGKYGLDHEELIDLSLGMTPTSGRSQAEIMENVNRAVLSAQGSLQSRAQTFKSFTDQGTPQSASQRSLRQGE